MDIAANKIRLAEMTRLRIYQPFSATTHPEHAKMGRLWGVDGIAGSFATVRGLTKEEATVVRDALIAYRTYEQQPDFGKR